MADEKKNPKKTAESVEPAPLEERALVALESIATSLAALTRKFAPPAPHLVGGGLTMKCDRGHGMQATDEYCRICYGEDHPTPGPRAA